MREGASASTNGSSASCHVHPVCQSVACSNISGWEGKYAAENEFSDETKITASGAVVGEGCMRELAQYLVCT